MENDTLRAICPLIHDICSKERCLFFHPDRHMCIIIEALLRG